MLRKISGNDTVSFAEQHRADKNLHEGKEKTMKQLRTRLLSAALAACMAVSVLPVSALALGGGIDPENGVSAQAEAVSPIPAEGLKIEASGTYALDKDTYTGSIVVDTDGEVTLNLDCDVTYTGTGIFIEVKKAAKVTINGGSHTIDYSTGSGNVLWFGADAAVAEVSGGTYKSGSGATIFNSSHDLTLTEVASDADKHSALYNSSGTVKVTGGTYTCRADLHDVGVGITAKPAIRNVNGGTMTLTGVTVSATSMAFLCDTGENFTTIYGGEYTSTESNAVTAITGTLDIYGGIFTNYKYTLIGIGNSSETAGSTVNVHGGTFNNLATDGRGQVFTNYGTLTIDDDYCETRIANKNGTSPAIGNPGTLFFKGGTITSPKSSGILVMPYPGCTTHAEITGGTISDCPYGVEIRKGDPTVILEKVTFENNENDIYLGSGQKITIKDTFTDPATVKVAESPVATPRQITTSDAPNQQNLKLTSNDDYLVAYDSTGNYRYLTKKTAGKYTVTAEHATAAADLGSGEETLYSYTEINAGTKVTLKADPAPAGEAFDGWEVLVDGTPNDALLEDSDAEETHFWMPAGSVTVRAKYKTVIDPVDPSGADNIKGALSAVVVGAAAGVILYEAGTGIYRVINMPGIILPSNRIELADLIWERAGKPEPQNTDLYDDIDEDDTDWQKAARWMVEQELMDDDIDEEKDTEKFHPYRMVTKLRVCLTWQKAKDQGLFDNTETKAE